MRNHHKQLAPTTPCSSSKSNNNKAAEQPHLSGAYIRSLVKQLSSSSSAAAAARSKDHSTSTMGTKPAAHSQPPPQGDDLLQPQQQQAHQTAPPPPQQQPHKKQVRRRLHTSRPYQERLLNMAEARREIVTALKIHRASMRQAKEQQQLMHLQLLQRQQQEVVHHHLVQQEPRSQAVTVGASSSAPSYASYSDYLYNSPFSHLTAPTPISSYSSSPLMITYDTPVVAPPPMLNTSSEHSLDDQLVPLPAQPLGLNLSFQGFNSSSVVVGDGTKNSTCCSFDPPPPLLQQPSPASSYSVYSSPSVTMASHDLSSSAVTMDNTSLAVAADPSLHRVLDDEEMAAIYSIGQQHDIEWSDTMNLVTSAWWSKLLQSIEDKGNGTVAVDQEARGAAANVTEDPSSLMVDMPADWVSDSLGHVATQESNSDFPGIHLSDYYHQEQDVSFALPRMDIGDIEGWDTEWFS